MGPDFDPKQGLMRTISGPVQGDRVPRSRPENEYEQDQNWDPKMSRVLVANAIHFQDRKGEPRAEM